MKLYTVQTKYRVLTPINYHFTILSEEHYSLEPTWWYSCMMDCTFISSCTHCTCRDWNSVGRGCSGRCQCTTAWGILPLTTTWRHSSCSSARRNGRGGGPWQGNLSSLGRAATIIQEQTMQINNINIKTGILFLQVLLLYVQTVRDESILPEQKGWLQINF